MSKDDVDIRIYRDDVYHCAKCHLCKSIDFHEMKNECFADICPSGLKFKFEAFFSSGKMEIVRAIMNKELKPSPKLLEIFYTCTLCGGCEAICNIQKELKPTKVFHAMRTWLMKNNIGPLPEHVEIIKNVLETGNPWGYEQDDRLKWMKGIRVPSIDDDTEVIFFVGSFISFDEQAQKIASCILHIFDKLKIKYGMLGKEETCCGSVVLLLGDKEAFYKIYTENMKKFLKYKKPIVVSCSGCYNMLKNYYDLEAQGIPIYHMTEYLQELIRKKRLVFSREIKKKATFHDPCHLGRHCNVYKAPRKLLLSIPGIELVEMDRNKENSLCCGAGGGVKKAFPSYAVEIAKERIKEALSTGAEILVSACPFCERNFRDAGDIEVKDIVELISEAI
ncbi:MAG: (Fe-S)-binding protein [Candidatus Helarchaeota archaeon]